MANLKVTLSFDDVNNTSFTYDKDNGLKSFSLLTESKTSAENLDYSVKSNTGSFSAYDIVPLNKLELNKSNLKPPTYSQEFTTICYNPNDGYYYIGVKSSIENNSIVCWRTKELTNETLEPIILTNYNYPNAETSYIDILGDYIVFLCTGDNGMIYLRIYNYLTNTWKSQFTVIGFEEDKNKKVYCFKVVNNILFIYFKDNHYKNPALMIWEYDDTSGNFGGRFIESSYNLSIYDVTYEYVQKFKIDKYTFITANGIYTCDSNFNLFLSTSEVKVDELTSDRGSIAKLLENNSYEYIDYFSNGTNKVYRYPSSSHELEEYTLPSYIGNALDMFSFKGNLFFISESDSSVYYTKNMVNYTKLQVENTMPKFIGFSTTKDILTLLSKDLDKNVYSVFYSDNLSEITKLDTYNSFYEWLLTKPSYENITIDITLDGETLGKYINNGKIKYNNNLKELSLDIQNPITILQNKQFKYQYDNSKNSTTATELLTILIAQCNLALNGIVEFEDISIETKEYLDSISIEYPYLQEDSLWNQLNKLCEMAQLVIYPKDTKIVIKRWV